MFTGTKKVELTELENSAKEITEHQASVKPAWGTGNISVNEIGVWEWEAVNHDTSG